MATKLTTADIDRMLEDENWTGYGYLGERQQHGADQVAVADAQAIDAANRLGMTYEQLFDWANSRMGRWFGDCVFGTDGRHTKKFLPGSTGH